MAVRTDGSYLARRGGFFGAPGTFIVKLVTGECQYDYGAWPGRTMHIAHNYIEQHWDEIKNEDVIDVEFIMGESKEKKVSERLK